MENFGKVKQNKGIGVQEQYLRFMNWYKQSQLNDMSTSIMQTVKGIAQEYFGQDPSKREAMMGELSEIARSSIRKCNPRCDFQAILQSIRDQAKLVWQNIVKFM